MRAALILAVITMATAAVSDAEARGFRRVGGGRSVGVGVGVGIPVGSAAQAKIQKASATPAEEPAYIRPILPVRPPAQAAETTRPASTNCASGRLVGQGAGFCQIN